MSDVPPGTPNGAPLPPAAGPPAAPSAPPRPYAGGDLWSEDGTSRAEVLIEDERVQVTLALPDIPPETLGHYVGSNILLLWSKRHPETERTLVRLPCDVRPETSVVRIVNGVFDLTVLMAGNGQNKVTRNPSFLDGSA